jgi:hypothetical protein
MKAVEEDVERGFEAVVGKRLEVELNPPAVLIRI